MDLIYKTLFEIRLLHEFFFINESGNPIFNEANATDREIFLMNDYMNDHESINRDVSFDFPDEFKEMYNGFHLRIIPSYSGCKVFVRVNKITMPDNSIKYQPFTALPDDLNIFIAISKNNDLIDTYTNSRMIRSVQSLYFFSNDSVPDAKTFPFIVNDISGVKSGYIYEQGELVLDSSNNLIEYYYDNEGNLAENFINSKIKSFSNENDRMLLPLKFDYTFMNGNNPTQATFEVKDKSGNTVKSISVTSPQPISKTTLDFSYKPDEPDKLSLSGVFSFQVNANNGFSESSNIFFADAFYSTSNWGIVQIKTKTSNTDFDLISSDGFLNAGKIGRAHV